MSSAGTKFVYDFNEGNRDMKDILGGKGANLAEMTNIGLPVPPGFTITTRACLTYLDEDRFPHGLMGEVEEHLEGLEKAMGKELGDDADPLLVSVRSGAKFSMPGMMDTILNLGLKDASVEGLKAGTRNGRFAKDSYRRFIQMYGNVVLGIDKDRFEHELTAVMKGAKAASDVNLEERHLDDVIARFKPGGKT